MGHEKQTLTYGVYSGGSALQQLVRAIDALERAYMLPNEDRVVSLVRSKAQ